MTIPFASARRMFVRCLPALALGAALLGSGAAHR